MEHFWESIDGCFSWPEFYTDLAKELAGKGKTAGVELGNFNGQSLAYLGVELINYGADCIVDGVDVTNSSTDIRKNLEPVLGKTIGMLHTGKSWDFAEHYANESLDFVFIDACHYYDEVKKDIAAWKGKVKPGGIICGHDYGEQPKYVGLKKAVQEVYPNPNVHQGILYKGGYYPVWWVRL